VLRYLRESYVSQDIFLKIEEKPHGADGTVLACLRDLRRYGLLIEAEMTARGVGVGPERPSGLVDTDFAVAESQVMAAKKFEEFEIEEAQSDLRAHLAELVFKHFDETKATPDLYSLMAIIWGVTRDEAKERCYLRAYSGKTTTVGEMRKASPASPWVIVKHEVATLSPLVRDLLYHQRGLELYALTSFVDQQDEFRLQMGKTGAGQANVGTDIIGRYYQPMGQAGYALRVEDAPKDWRFLWPELAPENNAHEMDKLCQGSEWIRGLFEWHETSSKWIVKPEHRGWVREMQG